MFSPKIRKRLLAKSNIGRTSPTLRLEILEDRINPSQIFQNGTQLMYDANMSEVNQLTISDLGGQIGFTEGAGVLIDASTVTGSTGSGTSTVTVPSLGVTDIVVFLSDLTDSLSVQLGPRGNTATVDLTSVTLVPFLIDFNTSTPDVESLAVYGTTNADTFTINNTSIPTSVFGNDGDDSFTVHATSPAGSLALNGENGNDFFSVAGGSIDGAISLSGGAGTDTALIQGTAGDDTAALTANSVSTVGSVPITYDSPSVDLEQLTLDGMAGNDALTVNGTSTATNVFGGDGNDSVTVFATGATGALTVLGDGGTGSGNDSITVNESPSIAGGITVHGGGGTDMLTTNFTMGNDTINVSSASIQGAGGAAVGYNGGFTDVEQANVNALAGDDTIVISSSSVSTAVTAGDGNDQITSDGTTAPTLIDLGNGTNNVTVGSGQSTTLVGSSGLDLVNLGTMASSSSIQTTLQGTFHALTAVGVASTVQSQNVRLDAIQVNSGPGVTVQGSLSLTDQSNAPKDLAINSQTMLNVSATISGSGDLINMGAGTTMLAGNNTYTGTTEEDNGTLVVNGQQPSSPVALMGGLLGGIGKVGTLNGVAGTLQPDDGTGSGKSLNVQGNVTLSAQVTYLVKVATNVPPGGAAFTPLMVNGAAMINNTMLTIQGDPSKLIVNGMVALLNTTQGASGTFVVTGGGTLFGGSGTIVISGNSIVIVLTSTGIQNNVDSVYRDLLGRPVDPPGLVFWQGELRRLGNDRLVTNAFFAFTRELKTSEEFLDREVTQAYQAVLGRLPDPGGLKFFVAFLRPAAVAAAEASSHPGANTADTLAALRSAFLADHPGATFDLASLNLHASISDVRDTLFASDEYFRLASKGNGSNSGFLESLYRDALGRSLDANGRSFFLSALNSGTSRSQVVQGVLHSAEGFTALVTSLYQKFLSRRPDAFGLKSLVFALQVGFSEERLIDAFLSSQEYMTLRGIK